MRADVWSEKKQRETRYAAIFFFFFFFFFYANAHAERATSFALINLTCGINKTSLCLAAQLLRRKSFTPVPQNVRVRADLLVVSFLFIGIAIVAEKQLPFSSFLFLLRVNEKRVFHEKALYWTIYIFNIFYIVNISFHKYFIYFICILLFINIIIFIYIYF